MHGSKKGKSGSSEYNKMKMGNNKMSIMQMNIGCKRSKNKS